MPLFIGFVEAGVPLGATMAFLITSPMVNEIAVVLLASLLGWELMALYVGTGVVIGVGAGLHGFVPTAFFARYASEDNLLAVPLAVLAGIPMDSNATGMIPVAEALLQKGVPVGTVLTLMMSVVAISLPEMVILRKVIRLRLIGFFAAFPAASFILVGYLFNAGGV